MIIFFTKHNMFFILLLFAPIFYITKPEMSFFFSLVFCLPFYFFCIFQKQTTNEEKTLIFISFLLYFISLFQGSSILRTFSYIMTLLCFFFYLENCFILKYSALGYLVFFMLNMFSQYETVFGSILIFFTSISFLLFLASFIKEKFAAWLWLILIFLLIVATQVLKTYRFSYLSITDILSLKTAIGIASNYHVDFSLYYFPIVISVLVLGVYCAFVKPTVRMKNQLSLSLCAFCFCFLTLGFYSNWLISSGKTHLELSALEGFASSVFEDLKSSMDTYDENEERTLVAQFKDDSTKNQVTPNIINILCETYADVSGPFSITPSRDPLTSFRALSEFGCQFGMTSVDTLGGGTSKSEWEYLTGLDIKNFSSNEAPFLNKCHTNYSFTADLDLYHSYERSFLHPFLKTGWNREAVYETFDYDNQYYLDNGGFEEITYVRNLPADYGAYEKILWLLKKEDPQFIHCVTIQNHGGYQTDDLDNRILIQESIDKKKELENYLTLVELSSQDIYRFVQYIDENITEPTLVVFYGDHFPGGFTTEYNEAYYQTPYAVYSNFAELGAMPDNIDLSLLYPNARAAAGLPLTAYEKYLLSLQGGTTSNGFILSRIEQGYY